VGPSIAVSFACPRFQLRRSENENDDENDSRNEGEEGKCEMRIASRDTMVRLFDLLPRPLFILSDTTPRDILGFSASRPSRLALVRPPCFDYELIRIENGRLDHARRLFVHPIRSR
jgi:hypothetical protein